MSSTGTPVYPEPRRVCARANGKYAVENRRPISDRSLLSPSSPPILIWKGFSFVRSFTKSSERFRQSVPPLGRTSAHRLARMERLRLRARQIGRQAHTPRHRRGLVPLVPRNRPRELRERRDRQNHQRALRAGESGSRRTSRCGFALSSCDQRAFRPGRLAANGLSSTGWEAVLRRHLFPARRSNGAARFSPRAPLRRRCL